ncbi:MAG: hypothetical protein ABSH04_00585 [Acidimicrobiales bacterium]
MSTAVIGQVASTRLLDQAIIEPRHELRHESHEELRHESHERVVTKCDARHPATRLGFTVVFRGR